MIIAVHIANTFILVSLSFLVFTLFRRVRDLERTSAQHITFIRSLHEMMKMLRKNQDDSNEKLEVFTEMVSELMDTVKGDQPSPPSE